LVQSSSNILVKLFVLAKVPALAKNIASLDSNTICKEIDIKPDTVNDHEYIFNSPHIIQIALVLLS